MNFLTRLSLVGEVVPISWMPVTLSRMAMLTTLPGVSSMSRESSVSISNQRQSSWNSEASTLLGLMWTGRILGLLRFSLLTSITEVHP